MSEPFVAIPWNQPFLPALLDIALDKTGGDLSDALFVFPHARPALYLTEIIRRDPRVSKPCILPRMEPVSALFALVREAFAAARATPVGLLDQVALLLGAVRALRGERGGLLRDLPLDDSQRFFPWGVRLAALMEELFTHNIVPEDYSHMEGQTAPFAAALLENLGALHTRYLSSLAERGWTTPGLDAFLTARGLAGDGTPPLPGITDKTVILAGFHTLTGSQRALFRHLWERHGAVVCLHADPKIARGVPHWSCTPLVRWAGAWGAAVALFGEAPATPLPETDLRFHAGYDAHSQLQRLREALLEDGGTNSGATAIVLPDTSLLLPVLHHLPDTDVNISMGYPLARSPLFRLLESILALQETQRETAPRSYHWKPLIALLRHPYLKMLSPSPAEKDGGPRGRDFRRFLHHAERVVRNASRYSSLTDLAERTVHSLAATEKTEADPTLAALFVRILQRTVFDWEAIHSPGSLATALQGLAELMRGHGGALWTHFPIDAECLYRLEESIIPQLAHTSLKEEALPPKTLFAILRQLLAEERVPFEAYPLVGNQIMGVLETRLLHFDRIFVLDLTEDRLPGTGGHDPLLPDSLRPLVGLPGARGRETVAAYNFFRLIQGARRVNLFWQEGVESQGLNDAKKQRSRFVEELLWREEQKIGRILAPEKPENAGVDGRFSRIPCVLPSVPREYRSIAATAQAKERMKTLLRGEISPSLLDDYLQCPARFFYRRIGGLKEVEGVAEGRDPLGTGVFLHEVLRAYFSQRLHQPVKADEAAVAALRDCLLQSLAGSGLAKSLPVDDRIMLEEASPQILARLLENHAGRKPLHLEEKFSAVFTLDGEKRRLAGVIDRVDEDAGELLVLDYKTGRLPSLRAGLWQDDAFWNALESWRPGGDDDVLALVAERFDSVQLPAYVHLVGSHTGRPVRDAAYVPLRMDAKDACLFGEALDEEAKKDALSRQIPLLFSVLLRHMACLTHFPARPGQSCDWCFCKNGCTVSPA